MQARAAAQMWNGTRKRLMTFSAADPPQWMTRKTRCSNGLRDRCCERRKARQPAAVAMPALGARQGRPRRASSLRISSDVSAQHICAGPEAVQCLRSCAFVLLCDHAVKRFQLLSRTMPPKCCQSAFWWIPAARPQLRAALLQQRHPRVAAGTPRSCDGIVDICAGHPDCSDARMARHAPAATAG